MFLNYFLHRGQAKPGSGFFRREERFEDFVDDFGGDGGSVVLDENLVLDTATGAMLSDPDCQLSARCHGLAGILEDA